ncbi:MAG TPA: hypothetical protein IAB94_00205 [Candidatus Coproplasma avicola]|uniref:Uncharacterized protein n=1 Tax=Candidatus Coproplasma avicola TaxID=2840744 RepID=A0A9D1E5A6_9FIRM|nr:hypothetical protein [Candidatus Coproplasma avicola]
MPILSKQRSVASNSAIGHCSMPNSSCGQLFLITYVISTERQCVEKSRIIIALLIDFSMRAAMPHLVEMTFFIEHISNQAKAAATFSRGGT